MIPVFQKSTYLFYVPGKVFILDRLDPLPSGQNTLQKDTTYDMEATELEAKGGPLINMIRYRIPGQDDSVILHLIETQLVPLSHLPPRELENVRKEMPARFRRGVTLVAVPGRNKSPAGFVHFMLHGELLYIDMLAVAPASQRRQWGRRLMEQAERFAIARGCKRAKVMVDLGNDKGLSFYMKMGYTIVRFIEPGRCYELEKAW